MEGNETVDFHETELVRLERLKSQITAARMAHLARLDEMQVATADGSRNLSEWVFSTARHVAQHGSESGADNAENPGSP